MTRAAAPAYVRTPYVGAADAGAPPRGADVCRLGRGLIVDGSEFAVAGQLVDQGPNCKYLMVASPQIEAKIRMDENGTGREY